MEDKQKILIVEDERPIAMAYGDFLTSKGYEVEFAYDGKEGLEKLNEFKPDLVLLDIVMPVMDGISMLKLLRNSDVCCGLENVKVMILTNLEMVTKMQEAEVLNCASYLIKAHYSLDEMLKKIKDTLKK